MLVLYKKNCSNLSTWETTKLRQQKTIIPTILIHSSIFLYLRQAFQMDGFFIHWTNIPEMIRVHTLSLEKANDQLSEPDSLIRVPPAPMSDLCRSLTNYSYFLWSIYNTNIWPFLFSRNIASGFYRLITVPFFTIAHGIMCFLHFW